MKKRIKGVATTPSWDEDALKIARDLVASAAGGSFDADPIIEAELSRPVSIATSSVCRHGIAIQSVITEAIAADRRFEVLRNQALPVTRTAADLASSRTSPANLKKIVLDADAEVDRIVNIDLVVIDEAAGWVGAFDIKRGAGPTATTKRKALERDLIALRLTLPSWARRLGYPAVEVATTGIVDFYGKAGFRPELTLSATELDELFGLQISARVDRMTEAVKSMLNAELMRMIEAAIAKLRAPPAKEPAANVVKLFDSKGKLEIARPFGPGGRCVGGARQ